MLEKLHIGDEKPHIEEVLTRLGFTRPTEENIIKLIRRFGFVDIFGRREVRDTTGLQDRASSALIGQMLRNRLLDTVKGHGKGKYRFRAAALSSENHACTAASDCWLYLGSHDCILRVHAHARAAAPLATSRNM